MRAFTPEEIDAIPSGPDSCVDRPVNEEDLRQGRCGRIVRTPVRRATKLLHYEHDDPLYFHDTEGNAWQIGEYADGGYYKMILFWAPLAESF